MGQDTRSPVILIGFNDAKQIIVGEDNPVFVNIDREYVRFLSCFNELCDRVDTF